MKKEITAKDNFHEVDLSGRFTFVDHSGFKELIESLVNDQCKKCVLNLSNLEFIDSAGLGMLVILKDELQKASCSLILKSPQGQVEKMLQVSHFDRMFDIEK